MDIENGFHFKSFFAFQGGSMRFSERTCCTNFLKIVWNQLLVLREINWRPCWENIKKYFQRHFCMPKSAVIAAKLVWQNLGKISHWLTIDRITKNLYLTYSDSNSNEDQHKPTLLPKLAKLAQQFHTQSAFASKNDGKIHHADLLPAELSMLMLDVCQVRKRKIHMFQSLHITIECAIATQCINRHWFES